MTLKKLTAGAVATLTTVTLAACGDSAADMDEVRGKELVEFSSACVDSPEIGDFEGSTKWAPQSQWRAQSDGQSGMTQGWIDVPREGHRYSVECNLSKDGGMWQAESVDVSPVEYSHDDLSDVEAEAMEVAYGPDFDPNEIVRLRGICGFMLGDDALYGESDGAKILCPDNDLI